MLAPPFFFHLDVPSRDNFDCLSKNQSEKVELSCTWEERQKTSMRRGKRNNKTNSSQISQKHRRKQFCTIPYKLHLLRYSYNLVQSEKKYLSMFNISIMFYVANCNVCLCMCCFLVARAQCTTVCTRVWCKRDIKSNDLSPCMYHISIGLMLLHLWNIVKVSWRYCDCIVKVMIGKTE